MEFQRDRKAGRKGSRRAERLWGAKRKVDRETSRPGAGVAVQQGDRENVV